jgi:hypothetical protein
MVYDELVVMDFPLGEKIDRNAVVRALLDRKEDIENTFKNNEYLKLDLTHQELVGIKSSASIGKMKVGDLPALGFVIANNDKYKDADMKNLGNVNMLYDYFSN